MTIPFKDCCSHPGRPLIDHLDGVGQLMHRHASGWTNRGPARLPDVARLLGWLHDLGKATTFFQTERLQGEESSPSGLGDHAVFSALLAMPVLRSTIDSQHEKAESYLLYVASLMAVLRHHGQMKDFGAGLTTFADRCKRDSDGVLHRQFGAIDLGGMSDWINGQLQTINAPNVRLVYPEADELRALRKMSRAVTKQRALNDFITAELLFSLLVWADKIDAATQGSTPGRYGSSLADNVVDAYKTKRFGRATTPETQLREEVYDEVEHTLLENADRHLFTLTAPTGAGKTLSVLNAALKLRDIVSKKQAEPPRVIYCLPFTSIIDQNFDVFHDVLTSFGLDVSSELMIKHHHLVGTEYRDHEGYDYAWNVGQLLIEAWDSEIVVTTFIQLLESLIGNRNSMLRKACRIPGAIVLLDEVQAIPRQYWEVVRDTMQDYGERFGTRFILLTATRPLIFDRDQACELLPHYPAYFSKFDRYNIHLRCDSSTSIDRFQATFVDTVRDHPERRHLAVMNTVESSIEVFEHIRSRRPDRLKAIPKENFFYLSTNITPRDRQERIRRIRESDGPAVIVSTQVIEAGVDISVDILHRDFAPFDCLVQSAGRCNRSNERPWRGEVYLWDLDPGDTGRRPYSHIYKSLLRQATRDVLTRAGTNVIPEREVLPLAELYFQEAKRKLAESEIQRHMCSLDFQKVADEFKLIDQPPRQSYFVQRSDDVESVRIWEEFEALSDIEEPSERRAAFQRIKAPFFERVIHVRLPYGESPEDKILLLTDDERRGDYYDHNTGFQGNGCAIF